MMSQKEILESRAKAFKELLLDNLNSDDMNLSISGIARAVGVDPSTINRYINSPRSHLPAYLITLMPDNPRTALLHWLDNQSGNPIKGNIDTSCLDGSIRDECEGIVEDLGMIIHLRRTQPGAKSQYAVTELFQKIREKSLRAEQELNNNA